MHQNQPVQLARPRKQICFHDLLQRLFDFDLFVSSKYMFKSYFYWTRIDKIFAYTKKNKIFFISTHVYPIVNRSILDEASGAMNLNEMSSSKQLLMDAPLKPAVII